MRKIKFYVWNVDHACSVGGLFDRWRDACAHADALGDRFTVIIA